MEENNNNSNSLPIILVIMLIGLVGLGWFFTNGSSLGSGEETEQAEVFSELIAWNENIDDLNEMFYTVNVYNFGNDEAKNIEVSCKTYEYESGDIIVEATDNVGNLASNSFEQYDIVTTNVETPPEIDYRTFCYVENCDGECRILYKDIPELKEAYTH